MDLIIKKADKSELKEAIVLSAKYCYKNTPDRDQGFTLKPIDKSYLKFLYVAKFNGDVIGVACATDFSKEDCKRYDVINKFRRKEICKVTVDGNYRGMNVATKILEFILNQFPNTNFYAAIMEKPVENRASKKLFKSLGFKCYRVVNSFHEDIDLREEVGLYVFENKFKNEI